MQTPFIEWKQLPRGSYRTRIDQLEADVFQIAGIGFRWNILDTVSGCYTASGVKSTLDAACEAAIKEMQA